MARCTPKALVLLAALVFLFASILDESARDRLCHADPLDAASCRVLDIQTRAYGEEIFRISIRLTEIPPYVIREPQADRPLRIELGRTRPESGFRANFVPNPLVREVRAVSEQPDKLALDFLLSLSQVTVETVELPSESILIVDLQLRPGVSLSSLETDSSPDAGPPVVPAAPDRAEGGEGPLVVRELPIALPEIRPDDAVFFPSPPPTDAAVAVSPMPPDRVTEDILTRVVLQFPRSDEMWKAYQDKQYAKAFELGLRGLRAPQPRESLEGLLYYLAECRYELARAKSAADGTNGADWQSVLNYYEQALRFSPDSPFRLWIVFRIGQINGYLGRQAEQLAALQSIWKGRDALSPLMPPDVLLETALAALGLHKASPSSVGYLDDAQEALKTYLRAFPDEPGANIAHALLAEVFYQQGDDQKAFESAAKVRKDAPLPRYPEMSAHLALAAHRLGVSNVVSPRNESDRELAAVLTGSPDARIRLEYAGMLKAAGNRRASMSVYAGIVHDFGPADSSEEIYEARLALTRFALEDALGQGKDPAVFHEGYVYPIQTLKELLEESFGIERRMRLLQEIARHLAAQGREIEALPLILPYLEEGLLSDDRAREMALFLYDYLPAAAAYLRKEKDWIFALDLYERLGNRFEDYPGKDDLLLEIARVFLDADFRAPARRVLDRLSPWMSLSPAQQSALHLLNQEMSLDPDQPDEIKRNAPALLDPDRDAISRRQAARLLGRVYAEEGNHAMAARFYLQGAEIAELPWKERAGFYENAALQYAAVPNYAQALEAAWRGLRDMESAGVPFPEAEAQAGPLFLLIGENFQRIGDFEKAALAYEQYLEYYLEGANAADARLGLAGSYERAGRREQAIEQYERLARSAQTDPFWAGVARKTAEHLRWESEHDYLIKREAAP